MDIIKCLQIQVNEILAEEYKTDECQPLFIVTLIQRYDNQGKIVKHEIGLTIQHMGHSYTRTLFPLEYNRYGYPDLKEEMKDLYNNTM